MVESTKPQVVERVEMHEHLTANRPLQMRSDGVTKRKRVGGGSATADQTESFSDNDDSEVAGYLNSKGESDYKKTIREKINALVVERIELHKKLTANRPLQMRSDGVTKRKRVGGGSATADQTESFSDIDDSEVAGYLNSKEESHYKKIIWEKINQQLAMEQAKRKKESESKKDKPGKGTAKTTKIDENKIRSSKVNYEALKQLTDELNQDIGDAEIVGGSRSLSCVNSGGSNAKEVEVYESNSDELEEEEENPCSEDDDALRDSNYELYDEHEYGYDIDYGHV